METLLSIVFLGFCAYAATTVVVVGYDLVTGRYRKLQSESPS